MHRAFPRFALLALMLLPFNGAAGAGAKARSVSLGGYAEL